MGGPNPDRIPVQVRYRLGRTVALMIENRWDVISNCDHCRLQMNVRLDWIARITGPDTSLWNRKARCRRLLCTGFTSFYAKAPGMLSHEPLSIDMKVRGG